MTVPPSAPSSPRLVGVGVGPGDPDLLTLRALHELRAAEVVIVPVPGTDEPGRAETTVLAHVDPGRVRRVVFALNDRGGLSERRIAAWDAAARSVAAAFADGAGTVAFATIGDPHVYSTFSYLAHGVRTLVPGVVVDTVPGITAMQDLASRTGTSLCEGTEILALVPATAGIDQVRAVLGVVDTTVAYKGGERMPALLDLLRETGRLDGAVVGSRLGLAGERIRSAAEVATAGEGVPYLSTLIVPARRTARGERLR